MTKLTQEQVEQYHNDGVIIPGSAFPDDVRDAMQTDLERFLAEYQGDADFVPDVIRHDETWLKYASRPEILEPLKQIMGEDVILWSSALFSKAEVGGKSTPWHQDGEYWPIRPLETVTAWIAIDDVDRDNGCLQVIPGSHNQRQLMPHHVDDSGEGVLALGLTEEQWHTAEPLALELKAGQFSLHDVYMVHGADANNSGRRRAGLVFRYMPGSSVFDRALAAQMVADGKVKPSMKDRQLYVLSGDQN